MTANNNRAGVRTASMLNELFTGMQASGILDHLMENYPGKVIFSSSMGAEDQVITHLLSGSGSNPPIFTLDTGRLFPETYDLIAKTSERYGFRLRIIFPEASRVEEMVNASGINLFYEGIEQRKLCCQIRKTDPLKRALRGKRIWVTGLRQSQSPTRGHVSLAQWDQNNRIIKVNPLLEWSEEDVWAFIREHRVPYNVLHDKDFPSLGCQPCTRAVLPGEDLRAGRWWWEKPETKECGLHRQG